MPGEVNYTGRVSPGSGTSTSPRRPRPIQLGGISPKCTKTQVGQEDQVAKASTSAFIRIAPPFDSGPVRGTQGVRGESIRWNQGIEEEREPRWRTVPHPCSIDKESSGSGFGLLGFFGVRGSAEEALQSKILGFDFTSIHVQLSEAKQGYQIEIPAAPSATSRERIRKDPPPLGVGGISIQEGCRPEDSDKGRNMMRQIQHQDEHGGCNVTRASKRQINSLHAGLDETIRNAAAVSAGIPALPSQKTESLLALTNDELLFLVPAQSPPLPCLPATPPTLRFRPQDPARRLKSCGGLPYSYVPRQRVGSQHPVLQGMRTYPALHDGCGDATCTNNGRMHAAPADTPANPRVVVRTRHAVSPSSPLCCAVLSVLRSVERYADRGEPREAGTRTLNGLSIRFSTRAQIQRNGERGARGECAQLRCPFYLIFFSVAWRLPVSSWASTPFCVVGGMRCGRRAPRDPALWRHNRKMRRSLGSAGACTPAAMQDAGPGVTARRTPPPSGSSPQPSPSTTQSPRRTPYLSSPSQQGLGGETPPPRAAYDLLSPARDVFSAFPLDVRAAPPSRASCTPFSLRALTAPAREEGGGRRRRGSRGRVSLGLSRIVMSRVRGVDTGSLVEYECRRRRASGGGMCTAGARGDWGATSHGDAKPEMRSDVYADTERGDDDDTKGAREEGGARRLAGLELRRGSRGEDARALVLLLIVSACAGDLRCVGRTPPPFLSSSSSRLLFTFLRRFPPCYGRVLRGVHSLRACYRAARG
ncbi:hypothetical protein DFH09DRAFT_1089927 [Mycena vulgaris]|nr:hypothetical protein DFH09DRAFT_1089927 [Mycena vulgaris]